MSSGYRYRPYDKHVYALNDKSRKKNWAKWRAKSLVTRRARYRETYLSKQYGITQLEFDLILQKQGGRCAVCKTSDPGKHGRKSDKENWHVDHDHETRKVRGLLCFRCNVGLGHLKDDPLLVKAALDYLLSIG